MPKSLIYTICALAAVLSSMLSMHAQMRAGGTPQQGKGAASAGAAPAPAPVHDLSGVWFAQPTAGLRGFIGDTWTKEEPALTPWGLARYKEAKASNGSVYTLDQTNDPVITKC